MFLLACLDIDGQSWYIRIYVSHLLYMMPGHHPIEQWRIGGIVMARAQAVHDELRKCGIECLVWLPDSETRTMFDVLKSDPNLQLVQVCREDEAVSVYFGLYIGGKEAAVLIQNTGLMNAVDAIRGSVLANKIPMLLMVGYRGYKGMLESVAKAAAGFVDRHLPAGSSGPRNLIERAAAVDSAATYTEPLLKGLGIPYYILNSDDDVGYISEAYRRSKEISGPVAVLVGREYE
jgi:sulfopyruvate decarboxylase TPP-binding subunit